MEARGGATVRAEDVAAVRQETMARILGSAPSASPPAAGTPSGGLADEALQAFVTRAEREAERAGTSAGEFEVKVCGGVAGCPLAVTEVLEARDQVAQALISSGAAGVVRAKATGPVLAHHRFRVSISGCPNACSQPQIADVGLIGFEMPRLDAGRCIGCGACVESCGEDALMPTGDAPELVAERCVGCGACIRSCPVDALVPGEAGWRVLAGGRLGRHPRLGREVARVPSIEGATALVRGVVELWAREGRPDERVGHLLDRLAPEADQVLSLLRGADRS